MPVVFGGRPSVPGLERYHCIDVDNVAGGVQATEHLVRSGRRRIATITGPPDMKSALDRLAGSRATLSWAGLAADAVVAGDFTAALTNRPIGSRTDRPRLPLGGLDRARARPLVEVGCARTTCTRRSSQPM